MLRSPILGPIAGISIGRYRSDRVGGAYGDLPFKVMFKTQLMGLIFILLQFIIVTDRKVQMNFSIGLHEALPQTTTNIIITFK